jgi:tetratricopeptide (TPR) repeat protein
VTSIGSSSRLAPLVLLLLVVSTSVSGQSEQPIGPATQPLPTLAEAQELYRTGDFEGSVQKYRAIVQAEPKSAWAYAGLARVYLKQEKIQQAFDAASSGLTADPSSPQAQVALAEVYFRQGKINEAEQILVKVVNSGIDNARAYLGLARIREAISMYKRAKEFIDKAQKLDPSDPDIQKVWMGTLKRSERIRLLESYLTHPTNDDSDERSAMTRYLQLMKERENNPGRNCTVVSKLTSTETPLTALQIDAYHLHGYGLSVKLNGHVSRLLLDTGASGILIKKSAAEKAGIKPVVESKIAGIGDKGDMSGYLGYADSIRIGELEFQNCLVEVSDKRSILGDDGIIGADVFQSYLVGIDFPNQKLKLSELPKRPGEENKPTTLDSEAAGYYGGGAPDSNPEKSSEASHENAPSRGPQDRYIAPEMQSYTRVFRFGHDLLIPTRVGNAPPKLFLIDTGAMFNSISPEAAREVTKVRTDSDMTIKGLSGTVKNVYSADKAILQFSHYRQENQDLTAFDLSKISRDVGTEVSGILGFTTLRMFELKIDYRDGLVDFVFNEQIFGR